MQGKDIMAAATAAAQAATGRYIGLAVNLLKNGKAILGSIVVLFFIAIIMIAVIVSLPGLIIQSILPQSTVENRNALSVFAVTELDAAENEKKFSIQELLASLIPSGKTKDDVELIGTEPSKEELMILYSVKYNEYFDASELGKEKVRSLTKAFLEVQGLSVVVKPFEQVVNEIGLSDEQKVIAMNMYESHMYDQVVSRGNADGFKDFGDVTYKNGSTNVVYFSQRDSRWAKKAYGDGTIGEAGCGPTSLAMAISSLTNKNIDPVQMCNWAYKEGYKSKGGGSFWSLIPDGGAAYGLKVEGNVKEAQQIVDALAAGKLVIAIMGPGHFTTSGHFIVLRGVTDQGKILVADSYSQKNTEKAWDLGVITSEVKKGTTAGGPFWILSNKRTGG